MPKTTVHATDCIAFTKAKLPVSVVRADNIYCRHHVIQAGPQFLEECVQLQIAGGQGIVGGGFCGSSRAHIRHAARGANPAHGARACARDFQGEAAHQGCQGGHRRRPRFIMMGSAFSVKGSPMQHVAQRQSRRTGSIGMRALENHTGRSRGAVHASEGAQVRVMAEPRIPLLVMRCPPPAGPDRRPAGTPPQSGPPARP